MRRLLARPRLILAAAVALALTLLWGAPAAAQDAAPPEPDPAAVKAMDAVMEAYRSAATVEVESTVKITLRQGEASANARERTARFTRVKDGPGVVEINGYRCHFENGRLSVTHEKNEDAYFSETYDGKPYWALLLLFQDLPFPHVAILFGEDEPADAWMMLAPKTPWIAPTEVATVERDGETRQEITLSGPDGSLRLTVDPKTKLISAMRHEVTSGPFVESGSRIVAEYTVQTTRHEKPIAREQVAFDPGRRQRVDVLTVLAPRAVAADQPPAQGAGDVGRPPAAQVGQPAPPFTLATLDGGAVDLSDFRGRTLVVDFWATWCPPCKAALPELHKVADWAHTEDLPVDVVTINVSEQAAGPDEWIETVQAFWNGRRFSLPVALDFTGDVMRDYGVGGIPTTIVIGPDGTIQARHEGYDAGSYVPQLKADIQASLGPAPAG